MDTAVNPIALVAFLLTCSGCVQTLVSIFLNNWWTISYSDTSLIYYGVWTKVECYSEKNCQADSALATELEAGQEGLFVSKVFATLTAFLSVVALVLHILYFLIRKPLVRTSSVLMLGAGALFGLLGIFVFVGFYSNMDKDVSLGAAFFVCLSGVIFLILAAAFTAWASIRKASTASGLEEMD